MTPTEPPKPRQYPVTGQPRRTRTSFVDLTGRTFGRWSVLGEHPKTRPGQSLWRCRCSCGRVKETVGYTALTTGRSRSCGCLKRDMSVKPPHERHSRSNPTWRAWSVLRNKSNVCPEWLRSFDTFLADMGPRPAGMHLCLVQESIYWCRELCYWGTKICK